MVHVFNLCFYVCPVRIFLYISLIGFEILWSIRVSAIVHVERFLRTNVR